MPSDRIPHARIELSGGVRTGVARQPGRVFGERTLAVLNIASRPRTDYLFLIPKFRYT